MQLLQINMDVCRLNEQTGHFDTSQAWYRVISFTRWATIHDCIFSIPPHTTPPPSSWNEAFLSNCLCEVVTAASQLVSCLIISHILWTHAATESYLTSPKSDEMTLPSSVWINLKNKDLIILLENWKEENIYKKVIFSLVFQTSAFSQMS